MSYDFENFNLGERMKNYRKQNSLSLENLSKMTSISKSTLSKYEQNESIPNAQTLGILCNVFNISISNLFPTPIQSSNCIDNPFKTQHLYLYYYTENKLITSIIDIYTEGEHLCCNMYNGISNPNNYQKCCYFYKGIMEYNKFNIFVSMTNNSPKPFTMLERIQITISVPWSCELDRCKGILLGLTPSLEPVIKKILISTERLSKEKILLYNEQLKFTNEELKNMKSQGQFILKNKAYDEFFFIKN